MDRIEAVQVRLYDVNNGKVVIDAFNQIPKKRPQFRVSLYQSGTVANDWSIFFWKSNAKDVDSKSPQAICLAESLRQVGLVNHVLWLLVPMEHDEGQGLLGFRKESIRRKTPQLGNAGP